MTRSCRSRSRSAVGTRSWLLQTKGFVPTPRRSRSVGCDRPSLAMAPSPPVLRPRSPMAACAVVVMSKAKAEELGLSWLAEIGASGQVAGPDSTLQLQPARAIEEAARKEGIAVSDIDLFELNEAFAAVGNRVGSRSGRLRGRGQCQRWRHRVGPSGRDVGRTDRATPGTGTQASGGRNRCRGAVRWRRSGRCVDHSGPDRLVESGAAYQPSLQRAYEVLGRADC